MQILRVFRAGVAWVHALNLYLRFRIAWIVGMYIPIWYFGGHRPAEFAAYVGLALIVSFVSQYEMELPELEHTQLVFRKGHLAFAIAVLAVLSLFSAWQVISHHEVWWWLVFDLAVGFLVGTLCSWRLLQARHELDLVDALEHRE